MPAFLSRVAFTFGNQFDRFPPRTEEEIDKAVDQLFEAHKNDFKAALKTYMIEQIDTLTNWERFDKFMIECGQDDRAVYSYPMWVKFKDA